MSETRVRLRAITEEDLPDYVIWLNDPEVTQFTQIESGGITLEGEREWFARITAPDEGNRHWAIELDGRHVGNCALMPDPAGLTAGFGIIIGDKTTWNRGCGTAALHEVLRIGFEEMGLHRVHLTALAENGRAIRCYEKCGFQREGLRRRHYLKGGRLVDVVCMGILREEWEAQEAAGVGPSTSLGVASARMLALQTTELSALRVRSYRSSDYEEVAALWREVGFHLDDRDSREALDRTLTQNPGLFLVAEAEGRPVGTVIGTWDGRRALIYRVAVEPRFRRQQLATRLMGEVERRLRERGARSFALFTTRENEASNPFYRGLGYDIAPEVVFMWKRVDGDKEECCGHERAGDSG